MAILLQFDICCNFVTGFYEDGIYNDNFKSVGLLPARYSLFVPNWCTISCLNFHEIPYVAVCPETLFC
jgi:hypothetical protein